MRSLMSYILFALGLWIQSTPLGAAEIETPLLYLMYPAAEPHHIRQIGLFSDKIVVQEFMHGTPAPGQNTVPKALVSALEIVIKSDAAGYKKLTEELQSLVTQPVPTSAEKGPVLTIHWGGKTKNIHIEAHTVKEAAILTLFNDYIPPKYGL